MFLVLLAFFIGFCTHILGTVIFADTKSDGVIHACVSKNGDVRIVNNFNDIRQGKREKERKDTHEDQNGCRENESQLSWNIQGPPGTSGSGTSTGSSFPLICPECNIIDYPGDRLSGKDLTNAVLSAATLTNTNLSNANLSHANLEGADLSGANLSNANLQDATLKDAQLKGATIDGIKWNNTTCPDGSNSNDTNNTCVGHFPQ